ncbi:MAG: Uncharacterised protein [Acidimicrobiales bacterium AG-410-I20]|nr:MAG: Uncharacterised protein [Acidimicrobiales bacterium AG-410-I20]
MAFVENARTAEVSDLENLERLALKSNEEVLQKRGGKTLSLQNPNYGQLRKLFEQAFMDELAEVFIGTIDDSVVGYGVIRESRLQDGTPHASIEAIYVEEEARSVGVGEIIMEKMLEWAQSRSIPTVDSVALPGDRQTKNFFETHGLVARAIIVQKDLNK